MATRQGITDDAEATLLQGLLFSQKEIFSSLRKLLAQIDRSGGRLVLNSDTVNLINKADRDIRKALNSAGYDKRVTEYLKDFDRIKEATILEQKRVNDITVPFRPLNNIQKSAIQQTTNILLGNGLDANVIQPVKDILLQAASSGMTIGEAELLLRNTIMGNVERLGKLSRYVTQISRDAIEQYNGLLQSRIAVELDLDGFSYEGSIIKDSREQCRRWTAMGEIPIKDLQGEIQWAYTNGSGMIPNTTPENFSVYRGGYSCRHQVTAIRL